jgi:hypothetical protein
MMTRPAPSKPGEKIKPVKPATAHQAHRTIRAALNEAVRRHHLTENPALLARAPQIVEEEIEPYSVEDIKRILETAQTQRNSARWALALTLGLRQGEALDCDGRTSTAQPAHSRCAATGYDPNGNTDVPHRAATSTADTAHTAYRSARRPAPRNPKPALEPSASPTNY